MYEDSNADQPPERLQTDNEKKAAKKAEKKADKKAARQKAERNRQMGSRGRR